VFCEASQDDCATDPVPEYYPATAGWECEMAVLRLAIATTICVLVSAYGTTIGSASLITRGTAVAVSESRFCTINLVMSGGRVSRVNYVGPTGGLLTRGEQCAFALENCVQK
jgi:hypothetical protein